MDWAYGQVSSRYTTPKSIRVSSLNAAPRATVDLIELVGADRYVSLTHGDLLLQARVPADQDWREGQQVALILNPRKLHFFSKRTGANLAFDSPVIVSRDGSVDLARIGSRPSG